jgi:hypothetical protein
MHLINVPFHFSFMIRLVSADSAAEAAALARVPAVESQRARFHNQKRKLV